MDVANSNHDAADIALPNNLGDSHNSPLAGPQDAAKAQAKEPSPFSKPCSLCQRRRDVLIRCQIDESKQWSFLCPGKCWRSVTGGTTHPSDYNRQYVYGGTWKNKHEYVSGKIKGKAKEENKNHWNGTPGPHRMRGFRVKKISKSDLGQSRIDPIGADDGGSDIDVSELSDWSEEFDYEKSEGGKVPVAADSTTDKKTKTATTGT